MKIIKDCWASLGASECQYGAHIFDGKDAAIYVNHWLAVFGDFDKYFFRKNSEGFVGHCQLVFTGVKRFEFSVSTYVREGDKVIWQEPAVFAYSGSASENFFTYRLEGSLHGFSSSVSILVQAQGFELRILGENEPARQS
ncbi:hypothetical protein [Paraburkholderia fungorum]|uniref:hypothetical protein n=1 Tax=Paraburkholderia fungorum TaxID=134537 RepID=UPI000E77BA16|nr:hypothetical protein [Paraburkholderia fungorum]